MQLSFFSRTTSQLLFSLVGLDILIRERLKKYWNLKFASNLLIGLATAVLLAGTVEGLYAWHTNSLSIQHVKKLVASANLHDKNAAPIIEAPAAVPSTIKPTPVQVASYSVPGPDPEYLIIPKLAVEARILSVGLGPNGALETPGNVFDTAWYNQSSQPGQPGAMLIDGHISSWTAHGVFYGLNTLMPGDVVEVKTGDGTMFNYRVISSQVYAASNVDMSSALTPIDSSSPGLNLISCTGVVIPGTNDFNQRIVVYATQV